MGACWRALQITLLAYGLMGYVSSSRCFDMFPENDIFILTGEDLDVNCSLKTQTADPLCLDIISDFDVHNLTIKKGSQELPSDVFTHHNEEKTLTLTLQNVTLNDSGDYMCYYSDRLVALKFVHVGEPPAEPENLICVSRNLDDLRCFFELSKDSVNIPITWTMEFSLIGPPTDNRIVNCKKNSDKMFECVCPSDMFHYTETYQILLEGINEDFSIQVNKSVQVHVDEAIVKPNPVRELGYELINSTRDAQLHWRGPGGLVLNGRFDFPMDYKIQVMSDWDSRTEWINNTMDESGGYDLRSSMEYNLTDLVPYTNYSVTVELKPVAAEGDIYWSNSSEVKFETPTEVADHAVTVTTGSFMMLDQGQWMQTILYWKNPPRKYWNGPITGYEISIKKTDARYKRFLPTSVFVQRRGVENEPEYVHEATSLSEVMQGLTVSGALKSNLSKTDSYQVKLMLVNSVGVSWNWSIIQIPDWNTGERLRPKWVSVETGKTGVFISWCMDRGYCEDVISVTYYWCLTDWFNSSYTTCKANFDWYTVNITDGCGHEIGHHIDIGVEWEDVKYAVSLEKGQRSGGMTWEMFRFSKAEVPEKPLYTASAEGNTLKIGIQYAEYTVGGGRPTQYTVVYKQCTEDKKCLADDTDSLDEKSFLANFSDPVYTISDIEPGTYQVLVKSENALGSQLGNIQTVTFHKESESLWILGAVLGSVAGVVVIVIVVFCVKRRLRKYQLTTQIKLPGHGDIEGQEALERDMGKITLAKSPDDQDSGKGSSPGSSLGKLSQPQEVDTGSTESPQSEQSTSEVECLTDRYHLSSEPANIQSSSVLSGYIRASQGDFPYEIEISDDGDDSLIQEETGKRKLSNPSLTKEFVESAATNSHRKMGPVKSSEPKPKPNGTTSSTSGAVRMDLGKSDSVKSLESQTGECDTTTLTRKVKNEKRNIDVEFGKSEAKYEPTVSIEYSKATIEMGTETCNVSKDMPLDVESEICFEDYSEKKLEMTDISHRKAELNNQNVSEHIPICIEPVGGELCDSRESENGSNNVENEKEIRETTASVCPSVTDSDLKAENTCTAIDTAENHLSGTPDETNITDIQLSDTGINLETSASFKDENHLSFEDFFDNSDISHYRNPDEVSLGGSTVSDDSESDLNNESSGSHEVSLHKTPSLEMSVESNAKTENNLHLESGVDNIESNSEGGKTLSEQSKSTSDIGSLESYTKTGFETSPDDLLKSGKIGDEINMESLKKEKKPLSTVEGFDKLIKNDTHL